MRKIATTFYAKTSTKLIKLNCQLANLTRSGLYNQTLHLFTDVHRNQTLKPDQYTLSTALTASAHLRDTLFGFQLHSYALRSNLISHSHVSNTLLSLYAKTGGLICLKKLFEEVANPDVYSYTTFLSACVKGGDFRYAREVFDEMPERGVAVWNAMITGCVESGFDEVAVEMFLEMHRTSVRHDNYSFASVLSLCSRGLEDLGRELHSLVIKTGFFVWPSVANALIAMYFNCRDVAGACLLFQGVEDFVRDEITFNVMIDGLVGSRREEEGLFMFRGMLEAYLGPTELTFVSLMSSCSCEAVGYQLHAQAIKRGYEGCTSVSNSAMAMYSGFGDLDGALMVFESLEEKDLVSWNTMISCYGQGKLGELAILVYREMQRLRIKPDEFTFGGLLVSSEFVETVEMIQAAAYKYGLISITEVSNALISAYSKHGKIEQAYRVFLVSLKNLISWNTLLSGFLLNAFPLEGLEQFSKLLESDFKPNAYTLSIVLSICTNMSSLRLGKQIHAYIFRHGHFSETSLGNALITLYSKCGVLHWSLKVFNEMIEKDVVSWNALISAHAQHGEGKEAVLAFKAMEDAGSAKPDQATFTAVLSACSHAGLVNEGIQMFNSMVKDYGFTPGVDHFSCIVDLLARAGYLDDAENVINSQNIRTHSDVWWALFSACAAHGNLKLGRTVAEVLLEQEGDNPSVYVLLSNIYAAAGQWKEAAGVRELMKRAGATKQRGCSWIRL